MIMQLAWRNLWRHPIRTLITVIAIAVTNALLIFMLGFQLGSYNSMKVQNLKVIDGFAQIQQQDFQTHPTLRHSFSLDRNQLAILYKMSKSENLNFDYGFRTETFSIISNLADTSHNASMIMGVAPSAEDNLSVLPNRIIQGRYLYDKDQNKIVIGKQLAKKLKVTVGDQVQILGTDLQGSLAIDLFEIVGIFSMNITAMDQQLVQMPLIEFQRLYAMQNRIQKIVFVTPSIQQIEDIQTAVFANINHVSRENIRWLSWQKLKPQLAQAIQLDLNSSIVFYGFLVLIVLLILGNTLYMSVVERSNELSLLNALGMRKKQLKNLVNLELSLMTFLGVILGGVTGILMTLYFVENGIQLPGTESLFSEYGLSGIIYPVLTWQSLLIIPFCFMLAMIFLAILLGFKINKTHPLEARRTRE